MMTMEKIVNKVSDIENGDAFTWRFTEPPPTGCNTEWKKDLYLMVNKTLEKNGQCICITNEDRPTFILGKHHNLEFKIIDHIDLDCLVL